MGKTAKPPRRRRQRGGLLLRSGQWTPRFQESGVHRVLLEAVTKIFDGAKGQPVCALSRLSLGVEQQECLAVVGPSGSGKTTALRLIAGLDEPTSGAISIGGSVVNRVAPKDRDVAMVFQNPALYPHLTVYDNLGFGLRLRHCPRRELDRQVRDVAEKLGLSRSLEARPVMLSAGQRQRVALGRALVRRAGVILLDEPLANVDPGLRAQMRQEIADLRRELGATMIYVTHDHLEAMMVGDRVAVLREGELQQVASPETLYKRPANFFVASFLGYPPMNLFPGVLVRRGGNLCFELSASRPPSASQPEGFTAVRLPLGPAPHLQLYSSLVMGLRPEHITCGPGERGGPAHPLIQGKLVAVQVLGPDTFVRACAGGNEFVARATPLSGWAPGQEYPFGLDVERALFFHPATGNLIAP